MCRASKVTVGAPFYNRVNLPIGLFLLLLTGVGPLLAWRSTSLRSIRRNFVLPGIAVGVTLVGLMIGGVRPWTDGRRYAGDDLLADCVLAGGGGDYGDWGGVSARSGRGADADGAGTCCASTVLLVRRNTRRYGGYLVHFGIVVMFIGIAGGAFNQSHEQEMGFGDDDADGAVPAGVPELYAGQQPEL